MVACGAYAQILPSQCAHTNACAPGATRVFSVASFGRISDAELQLYALDIVAFFRLFDYSLFGDIWLSAYPLESLFEQHVATLVTACR